MDRLNKNTLFATLAKLSLDELRKICISSRYYNSICTDPNFWIYKYTHDFNESYPKTSDPANAMNEYIARKEDQRMIKYDIDVVGATISFKIDPITSGLDSYVGDVLVWIEEYAGDNDRYPLEFDEIQEKLLPILMKYLLKDGIPLHSPLFENLTDTDIRDKVYEDVMKNIEDFLE